MDRKNCRPRSCRDVVSRINRPASTNRRTQISKNQDCRLSPANCEQISNAITHLESNSNSNCVQQGVSARARFNAFGYGFRAGEGATDPQTSAFDMYTLLGEGPLSLPTDRNTYVNVSGTFLLNEVMGGLIAHEEMHHLGYNLGIGNDPLMGLSYQTGFTCMSS